MDAVKISTLTREDMIPVELFGKDHWTTLAYIETRLVDYGGYKIAFDARMRTFRHNWRIFNHRRHDNPNGQRPHRLGVLGTREDGKKYGSRLSDGSIVPNHDDWDCIQDIGAAGFIIGDALEHPLRFHPVSNKDLAAKLKIASFLREQTDETGIDLGANIYLTEAGFQVTQALRKHKALGRNFASFRWPSGRY